MHTCSQIMRLAIENVRHHFVAY